MVTTVWGVSNPSQSQVPAAPPPWGPPAPGCHCPCLTRCLPLHPPGFWQPHGPWGEQLQHPAAAWHGRHQLGHELTTIPATAAFRRGGTREGVCAAKCLWPQRLPQWAGLRCQVRPALCLMAWHVPCCRATACLFLFLCSPATMVAQVAPEGWGSPLTPAGPLLTSPRQQLLLPWPRLLPRPRPQPRQRWQHCRRNRARS